MNNKFSENLKKIRKENNLSQEQLADELGVSRQAISKWESASAYPEMDKIIALCDKFNLNIDDLLHRDIKEVKGEEESKKKINNYIDDFLKFITDSINMFTRMSFKSKIKCIFEQLIIIGLLIIVSIIASSIFESLARNVFIAFLPYKVSSVFTDFISAILDILFIIASIVIVVHVFKTRYLDYYNSASNKKEENKDEEKKDNSSKEKIELKNNDNRIIIRDPKHSEYRFIKGSLKLIVYFIKFIALWIAFGVACVLLSLFALLVISFSVAKTGLLFVGILIAILSSSIITLIILLMFINFIFNRKNDKKKMIWSFIISIIFFGIGVGFICLGSLNFKVLEDDYGMIETKTLTYKMNNNFMINNYYFANIKYIESNNNDVKVEYKINKVCKVFEEENNNRIDLYSECDFIETIKEFLNNFNDKKIIPISHMVYEINVYTNKKNISIIKNNVKKEMEKIKKEEEERNYWEEQINELQNENDMLRDRVSELEGDN